MSGAVKMRVAKISFAEPIVEETKIATTTWSEQPLTLRDDAVEIVEGEPEEDEVFSHENDTAEDYEISGAGITISGSFIKASADQLVALLGGTKKTDSVQKSAKKLMLNKAIKFDLKDGSSIIVPNAKGYVLMNLGLGYGGRSKFPFSFKALVASPDWDCDVIF